MRGSINWQVGQILKSYSGIGESKAKSREESNLKDSRGTMKVSDKIHSYKSYENAKSDLKSLATFAKAQGVNDITKINNQIITDYAIQRAKEGISYKTISNQISNFSKVANSLSINKQKLQSIREQIKEIAPISTQESRAYSNHTLNLARQLQSPKTAISTQLQQEYGLRMNEATHFRLNDNILTTQGKGGYIITKEITQELADKIKPYLTNQKFTHSNSTYEKELRVTYEKVATKSDTKWNGTHGIRHTYAQTRLEQGATKEEISKEMGHHREEIIETYIR